MFKYKEETALLRIRWQNSATFRTVFKQATVNTNWVLYYCCLFSIRTTGKMHDFQAYFPGPSRTLSFNFQDESDFQGLFSSWNFQEKKIQDFAGCVGTLCAPLRSTEHAVLRTITRAQLSLGLADRTHGAHSQLSVYDVSNMLLPAPEM